MELRITLVVALLSLPALSARAQQPAGQPPAAIDQARQLCTADIEKLCKDADKNNKTLDCLTQHDKDISDDCINKFWRRYRVSQVCQADFDRLCKDVRPLGPCVQQHDAELSKECRAALVKGSKQQKAENKAEQKAAVADSKAAEKPAKSSKKSAKKK
jgi:hypothetical protein